MYEIILFNLFWGVEVTEVNGLLPDTAEQSLLMMKIFYSDFHVDFISPPQSHLKGSIMNLGV